VSKGAELLGDRWTVLIVRELLFGPLRFNEIDRGLPGISRSVLSERLRRLQRHGIIRHGTEGYSFTPAGEELRPVIFAIGDWVSKWILGEPSAAELDPELLMLWISRHVRRDALPRRRITVEFRFLDSRSKRIWLVLDPNEVSVCLQYPGLESDLTVTSKTRTLYRVYMGRITFGDASRSGDLQLEGLPGMVRAFPTWMTWSNFAPTVQAKLALATTGA
jgi:DNA-binding HxlR family transcriptional regulator